VLTEQGLLEFYPINIEGFSELVLEDFFNNIEIIEKSEIADSTINNLKTKRIYFSGTVKGVDASFIIGFVEGKDNFYQVMTWILIENKEKHEAKMEQIISSFKEI